MPGALGGILPNLKRISQSTVAKDGATTNGTVTFKDGFSFQKKDCITTGSNYYAELKNAENKDVAPGARSTSACSPRARTTRWCRPKSRCHGILMARS